MEFDKIPTEIWLEIFLLVEEGFVFVLPRVCKLWRVICKERMVVHQVMRGKYYPKFKVFKSMLGNFRDIRSINFSGCKYDFRYCLIQVVDTYPSLQSLNLTYCSNLTDIGITKIGEGCPRLQSLNLTSCRQVTDIGITKIAEGCPQLTRARFIFDAQVRVLSKIL